MFKSLVWMDRELWMGCGSSKRAQRELSNTQLNFDLTQKIPYPNCPGSFSNPTFIKQHPEFLQRKHSLGPGKRI